MASITTDTTPTKYQFKGLLTLTVVPSYLLSLMLPLSVLLFMLISVV